MYRFRLHRSTFLVASLIVPVLIAQDESPKGKPGDEATAKVKAKAKAKAKAGGPQAKAFQRIVVELDSNGDEVLQRSEVPDSARSEFDKLLELIDTDGDKALSRGELQAAGTRIQAVLGAGGSTQPPQAEPAKKKAAKGIGKTDQANSLERLKAMDADDDGKISRDEWKGAPALFERIDRDKDGFITGEEREFAVQAMRRFMESAKKKAAAPEKKSPEN
jgi:hypothetical protein